MKKQTSQFVICTDNTDYLASLEVGKPYRIIPDEKAEKLGGLRVIDEDGEDYLYDSKIFRRLQGPPAVAEC